MARTTLHGTEGLYGAKGTHLGYSDWLTVGQERVDLFAEATGDHQWIHVDAERAAAGPFGAPIAHGYLTLALSNMFLPEILQVDGFAMGVNYGAGKIRFTSPVKVGERIRGGAELVEVADVPGGVQTTIRIIIEIEGGLKPACVIESLSRWLNP